jgi:PAS domain-containing protein
MELWTACRRQLLDRLLRTREDWLMDRVLSYAKSLGYAAFTSSLKEAWRLSISGLTESILIALDRYVDYPEIGPEDDCSNNPAAQFGRLEAQRHHHRGITLHMFLGLMKYYRQSYIDMIHDSEMDLTDKTSCERFIYRIFDLIEIGFCVEWTRGKDENTLNELQARSLRMMNEKNRYLTILESIPNPVITLNEDDQIDHMNFAAARLFGDNPLPGSKYYRVFDEGMMQLGQSYEHYQQIINSLDSSRRNISELPSWLREEIDSFHNKKLESLEIEKRILHKGAELVLRVKIAKNLDVTEKFEGSIIILEDITSLKKALLEVKTLRGFVPICSYCKNIRNDEGFWQQLDKYIQEHSEAEFSHGICPDCMNLHFPNL